MSVTTTVQEAIACIFLILCCHSAALNQTASNNIDGCYQVFQLSTGLSTEAVIELMHLMSAHSTAAKFEHNSTMYMEP